MSKKVVPKPVTAFFRINLDVGMSLGSMPLEDALTKARGLAVTDVVDLKGLDYNDGDITITGIYVND
jgi:hypothetical protein